MRSQGVALEHFTTGTAGTCTDDELVADRWQEFGAGRGPLYEFLFLQQKKNPRHLSMTRAYLQKKFSDDYNCTAPAVQMPSQGLALPYMSVRTPRTPLAQVAAMLVLEGAKRESRFVWS